MSENNQLRLDFLKEALHDTQELIRFIDTKTSAIAVFLTSISFGFIIEYSNNIQSILDYFNDTKMEAIIKCLIPVIILVLPTINLLIVFYIFYPYINPKKNIELGEIKPKNIFFLNKLGKNRKVEPSLPNYLEKIKSSDYDDILIELAYEFQKLSYIRTMKEKSMKLATCLVFIDLVIFLISHYLITFIFISP